MHLMYIALIQKIGTKIILLEINIHSQLPLIVKNILKFQL
jgi:hypothetical protein